MANWQMTLDFSKAKREFQEEKITIADLAKAAEEEINKNLAIARAIDEDLADELECDVLPLFEEFGYSGVELTVEDFDDALSSLYDWADTPLDNKWGGKKMCWVVP